MRRRSGAIATVNRLVSREGRSALEDKLLADACRQVISDYRVAAIECVANRDLTAAAHDALLHLGGDPDRSTASLGAYDHHRLGPFLGVSDDGSASAAIRDAALSSPKVRALGKRRPAPLEVGVAVDAERLGGIGEVLVGPEEWAKVWIETVDRVLVTTNIGTRVNMRVYKKEPSVRLEAVDAKSIRRAERGISEAFRPFVKTPDGVPRPLTVFVEIPNWLVLSKARKAAALRKLARFVDSGRAAGLRRAPEGHQLGYSAWVKLGLAGKTQSEAAIDLASAAGIEVVMLDGVTRKDADKAISFAGLLNYFKPQIVGPLLRRAKAAGVHLRAVNLPDPDTIAREVWAGLNTARCMGAHLGKYGCLPLTLDETRRVAHEVQKWTDGWTAAPVFFVDQGQISEKSVDVDNDLTRGLQDWLVAVSRCGGRVVLVDTFDKASGRRLLKKNSNDKRGCLSVNQIKRMETLGRRLGLKILWAGGLGLRESYELGLLGVFGIYLTSAASIPVVVGGTYEADPGLPGVKRVHRDLVLRAKILLEAGFLAERLTRERGEGIAVSAKELLVAIDKERGDIPKLTGALADKCFTGWKAYWRGLA